MKSKNLQVVVVGMQILAVLLNKCLRYHGNHDDDDDDDDDDGSVLHLASLNTALLQHHQLLPNWLQALE